MDQITLPKIFKGSRSSASYLPLAPAVPRKTAMLYAVALLAGRRAKTRKAGTRREDERERAVARVEPDREDTLREFFTQDVTRVLWLGGVLYISHRLQT
ncbi:hypothetical protein MPTK1_6g00670 [Marchantia polymorpha subsp. ruderalis]|uniref:Uncharacterized protein n=2 Tax=Marchantia polymorpha TaxID=3197 RepID=A0AAF6BM52_MARPO|nr:hypothetical protein MARPO_0052s0133 [Marchantia polymorpha]BBN13086.1 hypothetical protein Mp_6g00670 [Marchantia polymorpha subsp. ruderalis]|eukprot:PTQ38361.1 hypothetical protein MARPO_0052s0133 [Marchantia polymorpha]